MVGALVTDATIVDDRYRVVRAIGAGTMGTVYEVEHLGFGRRLAMKVLHSQATRIESLRRRFEREAYSIGQLDDPRIVDVTDVGQLPDGRPYIIMGFVDGTPLSAEMKKGPMPVARAVAIAKGILGALSHAHARGVIHRDLKPDNVMLLPGDAGVKLLDFGLARLTGPQPYGPITKAGSVFGTPRYMAPEQASGEGATPQSDLYSVGILLYEMIRGEPLFPADTAMEAMRWQMTQSPEKLRVQSDGSFDPDVLAFAVDKALSKHPGERFHDAAAFIGALEAAMMPPPKPARWPWAAAAAVLMFAAAAGVIYSGQSRHKSAPTGLGAVQEALRDGNVRQAVESAEAMVVVYPERGGMWLALALARRAEGDDAATAHALAQALRLKPALADDPVLLSVVRDLVGARSNALIALLDDLAEAPKGAWLSLLTELAQTARRPHERRRAWEVLERIGDFGTLDPFSYLSHQLRRNRTGRCTIRAWYVTRLIALDDPRVREVLQQERSRPSYQRACMNDQLKAALDR